MSINSNTGKKIKTNEVEVFLPKKLDDVFNLNLHSLFYNNKLLYKMVEVNICKFARIF